MHNLKPLARVIAYSDSAVNPVDWPVAPAKGIQDLLNRAGSNKYFFQEKTVDIISCKIHVKSGIFCPQQHF